jgi:arylsulfatase A-like enzyme
MFTGLYPHQHNCHSKNKSLDDRFITIAEILSANGYGTGCFTANPWLSKRYNCSKGFEELQAWGWMQYIPPFPEAMSKVQLRRTIRRFLFSAKTPMAKKRELEPLFRHGALRSVANALHETLRKPKRRPGDSADRIRALDGGRSTAAGTRLLKRWMREQADRERPFFAFCNYIETHAPFLPPRRFRYSFLDKGQQGRIGQVNQEHWDYILGRVTMSASDFDLLRGLYDAEIRYMSSVVSDIYDFLRRMRILDNTILVITSDHGDNLGDHQLMGHVLSLHETITRVPLIVAYPGGRFQGERMGFPVQLHDLFQTIIRMTGVDFTLPTPSISLYPPDLTEEAFSRTRDGCLFAEYMGNQASVEEFSKRYPDVDFAMFDYDIEALYRGAHKYVRCRDGEEIYDIARDESESDDLSGDAELLATMRDRMTSFKSTIAARHSQYMEELPRAREKLRMRKTLGQRASQGRRA